MFERKCPWCGEPIIRSDARRADWRKTPKYLIFARCSHCDNYYGQNLLNKRGLVIVLVSLGLPVVLSALFEIQIHMLMLPLLFIGVVTTPLIKMTEDATPVWDDKEKGESGEPRSE